MIKSTPYQEKLFTATIVLGVLLSYFGMNTNILINISLLGLGMAYFFYVFKESDIEPKDEEEMKFSELLGLSIIPKVLWISSSVSVIGILFHNLDLDYDGYLRLLQIGGSTITIGTAVLFVLKFQGTKYINAAFPILLRTFPILVVVCYILFVK